MKKTRSNKTAFIFQVYRANLKANSLEEFQGERLIEWSEGPDFISQEDTIALVKDRLQDVLQWNIPDINFNKKENITLILGGRPLKEDSFFYANHFILLPTWIQILIHQCSSSEFIELLELLRVQD